jgi:S1-C subfamily serine protease
MFRPALRLSVCLSLALLLAAAAVATQPVRLDLDPGPAPAAHPLKGRELYQQTIHATAVVLSPSGQGTGWVLDTDARLLITNYHVVSNGHGGVTDTVRVVFPVFQDGQVIPERKFYQEHLKDLTVVGHVLHTEPVRDLALVQFDALPADVHSLALAPEGAQPGDAVFSIGNPGASDALWVFNTGTVRQVYHKDLPFGDGKTFSARVIETQNPINPGDSGGPLVNDQGQVVGMNSSRSLVGALVSDDIDVSELRAYLAEVQSLVALKS